MCSGLLEFGAQYVIDAAGNVAAADEIEKRVRPKHLEGFAPPLRLEAARSSYARNFSRNWILDLKDRGIRVNTLSGER